MIKSISETSEKKTETPLITIIVPVYNVEKYLKRCIDSIINQTYQNLEIILVDDGSSDNCPQICDEYAEKDIRIKVIHQENAGVSKARSVGIQIAKGEYVGFVDSDDYISLDYCERLITLLIESKADCVCCNFIKIDTDEPIISKVISKSERVGNAEKLIECYLEGYQFLRAVWGKFFKKALLDGCIFPDFKIGEDTCFVFQIILKKPVVQLTDYKGYFYSSRSNTASRAIKFTSNEFDRIRALDFIEKLLEKDYSDYCVQIREQKIRILIGLYAEAYYSNADNQVTKTLIDMISEQKVKDKTVKIKTKVQRMLILKCRKLYNRLLKRREYKK